jgi:hypothetical protein
MRSELGFQSDTMRSLRRHPSKLQELEMIRDPAGKQINLGLPRGRLAYLIPGGWFYQNQYRAARLMERYYVPVADVKQGTFSPALARRGEAAVAAEAKTSSPYNRFSRLIWPWLSNGASRFAYGAVSVNLARTAIALERYRLAHGAFPESLDALAPQYIEKVPHDVIGGQPLKYRREAKGAFLLYSVGWNEKDDDGEVAFNPDGTIDFQSGDWVWRSAVKAE